MGFNSIIQITKDRLQPDEYISEEFYYDNFVGTIADYVDGDINREKELEFFQNTLGSTAHFSTPDEFQIVNKNDYFRSKFMHFTEQLRIMGIYTLEQFSGDTPSDIDFDFYKLRKSYSDKFGVYIEWEGGTVPIADFLRHADTNTTYYVGGIIKYHY